MRYWYDKEFKGIVCEPDNTDEWLELIWDVGYNYDGYTTADGLKSLVDELLEMAQKARACLYDGKIFDNKEETFKSRLAAEEEYAKDKEG